MTDNELIANFIGKKLTKVNKYHGQQWEFKFCDGFYPTIEHMKFNTSWDWLMPVVKKIYHLENEWPIATDEVTSLHIYEDIETVYMNVVKIIKWYNTQRQ